MTLEAKAKGEIHLHPITLYQRFFSYIFVDFRNAEDANSALSLLNNHPFDTKHTFKLNRFTDIEAFANLDETYVAPEEEEYIPKVSFLINQTVKATNT